MGRLILILGGARSGKSSFAVARAKKLSSGQPGVVYVATASCGDEEMKRRIERHRKSRPASWKTVEERVDTSKILAEIGNASIVIIDCLTILISNLLLSEEKEAVTLKKIKEFFRSLKRRNLTALIVSNEVGMGIVPENRLGRNFRDIAGQANQIVAKMAEEVYLLEAGIPIKIKE